MSNKSKHLILELLLEKLQSGEERSGLGITVTDLGKSMTNIQIHKVSNLDIKEIDNLCYTLTNQGHISIFQKDEANKAHRYLITESGRQATIDKTYLSDIWYKKYDFWIRLIPVVIACGALIWTILKDIKNNTELNKMKTEIELLKTKIK